MPATRLLRYWVQAPPACPWLRSADAICPALLATDNRKERIRA
jgi:hypothetical protein